MFLTSVLNNSLWNLLKNPLIITRLIYLSNLFNVLGKVSAPLFTLFNEESIEQLSVSLGRDVSFYYEDIDGLPEEENLISFGVNIDDGE